MAVWTGLRFTCVFSFMRRDFVMTLTNTALHSDDSDKAILAYVLTKGLPAHDAYQAVQEMFGVSKAQAAMLINKGRRLAAQTIGRKP